MIDSRIIRVLILVDGMPAGGTERQVVELLKGLKQSCPRIYTLFGTLVKGGEREQEACRFADEVVPIRQSHQLDITLCWSLVRFVKTFRIDIIHTFGCISDLSGAFAARMTGIKQINGSIRNARRTLSVRDRLSKFAMYFSDEIVANSKAGLAAYGIKRKDKGQVIYNGVDFARFEKVLPFQHHRPYICMVGNFTKKKDHKALITAFPLVLSRFPEYDLVLVGKGKKEKEIRCIARNLGIHKNVIIINNCNAPETYIKSADVCLLLSSDGEGLSNVIIEYYALCKPVIASNLGGNREIVSHAGSGLLLDSHSQSEVSRAIIELLADREKSEIYAAAGRERVMRRFALERMISEYSTLYCGMV